MIKSTQALTFYLIRLNVVFESTQALTFYLIQLNVVFVFSRFYKIVSDVDIKCSALHGMTCNVEDQC